MVVSTALSQQEGSGFGCSGRLVFVCGESPHPQSKYMYEGFL